ncbi:LOW QUALITY PROTEIN: maltose O-acetyltransferase [Vibrio sp. JCM 19053]|nr:LOW QUALITY PROTEIN: maltose O-acetyltransferase [Vibrio sp. JCM 19053]
MSEKEKMLAGELYDPSDEELLKLRLSARLLTEKLNATSVEHKQKRVQITKRLFGTTGDDIHVESSFNCDYGSNIHVGDNFYANFGCVILDVAEVKFGDNCLLGPQVGIYTATHPILSRGTVVSQSPHWQLLDRWPCRNQLGVTLGNNVVVASGAVVTKSFGDNVVVGGNPARVLKEIVTKR